MIAWEEQQREGRGRWDDVIEAGDSAYASDGYGYAGATNGNGTFTGGSRNGNASAAGLDPGKGARQGACDEEEGRAEVKFKGRGSMKYRERRW